jgi:hypothetical protein
MVVSSRKAKTTAPMSSGFAHRWQRFSLSTQPASTGCDLSLPRDLAWGPAARLPR